MESLLKKEKKSSTCVDIIERKALEVEDNINVLENIFKQNTHGSTILSEELDDLQNLLNRIHPFSLSECMDNIGFLKEKLSTGLQ